MRIVICLFIASMLSKAYSMELKPETFLQQRLQTMMQSSNLDEFDQQLQQIEKLQDLSWQCRFELKDKSLPLSCFEYLEMVKIQRTIQSSEWNLLWTKLDEVCVERTQSLRNGKLHINFDSLNKKLGNLCLQEIRRLQAEYNYKNLGRSALRELFSDR